MTACVFSEKGRSGQPWRSAGNGAYFSGELSTSVNFARKGGGSDPGVVLLVALMESGNDASRYVCRAQLSPIQPMGISFLFDG